MTTEETVKPKVSYDALNTLVLSYRDHHDSEAADGIIDAFEGYIVKFFNLVRYGRINMMDRELREFVKLYMTNDYCRRNIHRYKYMPVVEQEILAVCDRIKKICHTYSDDDLKHEIYMAILIMAKRYKSPDEKPRFHTYIVRAFHYQLRRQLQILTADQFAFKMIENEEFDVTRFSELEGGFVPGISAWTEGKLQDRVPSFTIEEEFEDINENWVLGFTNDMDYANLTIMERRILKMYYIDELSDQEIANQLGTCRATINRKRNRSKEALRGHFEDQGKLSKE